MISEHGLSQSQAAILQGVTPSAMCQRLQDYAMSDLNREWKAGKAEILSGKQAEILNKLTDADIKRMMEKAPGAAALWFNSLFNAERLERGQATSISEVDIRALVALIQPNRSTNGTNGSNGT